MEGMASFEGLLQVVAVSVQAHHTVAIAADGAVFAWGKGEHGCLGHGEDPWKKIASGFGPWSTWSAVINRTSRAGELRSAPSGPDDWHRVTG